MSDARTTAPRPLPGWLIGLGSLGIAFHLFALGILALAASSGPWVVPPPVGTSPALGPKFAERINRFVTPYYLEPLRMTHNYHFITNRPERQSATFDLILRDKNGRITKKWSLPDADANPWVAFRQQLLAMGLVDDEPVQVRGSEQVGAAGKKTPTLSYWDSPPGETTLKLTTSPSHLAPRDRPLYKPRDWSLLLARSYMRYACAREGAATAELVRRVREPIMPVILYMDPVPANPTPELVCSFGEQRP